MMYHGHDFACFALTADGGEHQHLIALVQNRLYATPHFNRKQSPPDLRFYESLGWGCAHGLDRRLTTKEEIERTMKKKDQFGIWPCAGNRAKGTYILPLNRAL